MDSEELCALCYEILTKNSFSTFATVATTQCCREPICQQCQKSCSNAVSTTLTGSSEPVGLVCGNCGATTKLSAKSFPEVVKSTLANLITVYTSVLGHTQAKLEQINSQPDQFDGLRQQLQTNMATLVSQCSQVDQLDRNQLDCNSLKIAVTQHSQVYSKNLALLKADHHQLERQIVARIKYLTKLGHRLNHLNTRWDQVDLAALTELIQLDYDLNSVAEITIPTIPSYQPMRWFNHRLVVDDVESQFHQAAEGEFRHRTTHVDIIGKLEREFDFPGVRPSFLVELPKALVDDAVELELFIDPVGSIPAYLTCYTSYGMDAFALVDQSGRIIYYQPNIILTATKDWLIELVPEPNSDDGRLRITPLRELLNQPEDYRLNKLNEGLSNLVTSLYIRLNCRFGTWPLVEFYQDDLVIIYKSRPSVWLCQRWRLGDSSGPASEPKLLTEFQLPPQQRVLHLNNNTVIVAIDQVNEMTRYYYDSPTNVLKSGSVALTQPLDGQRDEWFNFKDGSVLLINEDQTERTGQLWRPDPVGFNLALPTIPYQLNEYNTTPWDGRLYRMISKSDGEYYDENEALRQQIWSVVIEFY